MFVTYWASCENGFSFHGNMEVEDKPVRSKEDVEFIELYIKAHLIDDDVPVDCVTMTGWKRWDA